MNLNPDSNGFYGMYGGAFVPEVLYPNVLELQQTYSEIIGSKAFVHDQEQLLRHYVGRPTPLTFATGLSEKYGARVYLKREDLCHTGSHKLNNVIGQILLAKHMGKRCIIAETGAGQHGVATATVCALMKFPCKVFMGAKDMARQQPNVFRMRMLGAEVIPVQSGSQSLKDATNEAIRYWVANPEDTYYLIGSVIGPHPYPDMVARFQSVISREITTQLTNQEGCANPNYVLACVGGGSNAIGAFYHFINSSNTHLVAAEAAGKGVGTGYTAATMAVGSVGVIHGCKTRLIQTDDGQIVEAHSVSAGLDYPGIGPFHAALRDANRVNYLSITDAEALAAAFEVAKSDGIIPALESAHALAVLPKLQLKSTDVVVVNLSGRGDKDMETYASIDASSMP